MAELPRIHATTVVLAPPGRVDQRIWCMGAVCAPVRASSVEHMAGDHCVTHEWTLRAVELADNGTWAGEACERCGDERVVPPTWTHQVELFANQR